MLTGKPKAYLLIPILMGLAPLLTSFGRNWEYESVLIIASLSIGIIPLLAIIPSLSVFLPNLEKLGTRNYLLAIFIWAPLLLAATGLSHLWLGQCQCSSGGFVTWFILLAYPAQTIGYGIAAWIHEASKTYGSRKTASTVATIYLLTIICSLLVIWFYPQKRQTSLLLSFLHGPIYDRRIELDWGVVMARLSHLLFGGFLVASSILFPLKRYTLPALIAVATVSVRFGSLSWPSQQHGHERLQDLLPEKVSGPGYDVYHNKTSEKGKQRIRNFVTAVEFHLGELSFLKGNPATKIKIYVYPNRKKKKLWFGGGGTDITDVYSPSIHTTVGDFHHGTLRHELVHALTSDYGFHGLGFHPNMAFTEGIAVALAPWPKEQTLSEATAQMLASGRMPDINALLSPLFWGQAGSRSYTVAGSLLNFLIKNYGIEKVKELYSGASFYNTFKKHQDSVIENWQKEISIISNTIEQNFSSEKIFRSKGVLWDHCPHTRADYRSRNHHILTRIRQPISWSPATDYVPWMVEIDPTDLEAKLWLWKSEIRKIARGDFSLEGRLRPWFRQINKNKKWPPTKSEEVEVAILEADMLRISNEQKRSYKILRDLKKLADDKNLGDRLTRQIYARIYLEEQMSIERAEAWRRYLSGWKPAPPKLDEKPTWISLYLTIRNPKTMRDETPAFLLKALKITPPKNMPKTFYVEWYDILGYWLAKNDEYESSEKAYKNAELHSKSGSKSYYQMLVRKMSYFNKKNNAPESPE